MQTQPPVQPVMILRKASGFAPLSNCASMAVSSDSMDTSAAARLTALAADMAGLLYRLYFATFLTAVMML